MKIVKLSEVENKYKEKAISIFVDSFYNLYTCVSKDKDILKEFFLSSFDFNLAYIAMENTVVLGVIGIETNEKRMMKFDKNRCVQFFGKVKGNIIYYQLYNMLEKPKLKNKGDIGIDYLATDKNFRGKGIATKLLEYAFNEILHDVCYIDVLSNNTTAKRLYEYVGFKEYKRKYSLVALIEWNGYISKMKKSKI